MDKHEEQRISDKIEQLNIIVGKIANALTALSAFDRMERRMSDNGNNKSWTEYFRLITPFLLLVLTFIGGNINSRLNDIDNKLFKHLTNDEIHTPKTIVVSKAEFAIYQSMRDKQMDDIKNSVSRIESVVEKYLGNKR